MSNYSCKDLDFVHLGKKVGHDGRACLATAVALASLIPPTSPLISLIDN